jgi:nicotinamidase-related amidase
MNTALLIIDIQNDYFPDGEMELVGAVESGTLAGRALAAFREKSLPVIHVQHIAAHPGATFFPSRRNHDKSYSLSATVSCFFLEERLSIVGSIDNKNRNLNMATEERV